MLSASSSWSSAVSSSGPGVSSGGGPREAYRSSLLDYKVARLAAVARNQGLIIEGDRLRTSAAAGAITEHLDHPAAVEALAARAPHGARLALSLFAITERTWMPFAGLSCSLAALGAEPLTAVSALLELGLLAVGPGLGLAQEHDFAKQLESPEARGARILVHPTVPHAVRTVCPEGRPPLVSGPVGQVREADGLEAILRLAALWQRAGLAPLRQTRQGEFYKRDRDRLLEDLVLSAPIDDALAPLPDLPPLWLELACRVGALEPAREGHRLEAAGPDFWANNAVHLPQMVATAWLSLQNWDEIDGASIDGATRVETDAVVERPAAFLRPALLLWLATLGDAEWVALDDLCEHLKARWPAFDQAISGASGAAMRDGQGERPTGGARASASSRQRGPARGRSREAGAPSRGTRLLESILLGAAYPLGLVRAGEEQSTGRRAVQLAPLGRYVLAAGPTPPPRPVFDQFLFVQPNFEMIAYRQGLTPLLAARLSRFAWWARIGSALELTLTRESVLFGLDGGLSTDSILESLGRHTQRPLPAGIVDAVRTWATRRERVTFHTATTLIEFASELERDQALGAWPRPDLDGPDDQNEDGAPVPVADRFLLVDDESTIPFDRFRMAGARDYRRPAEPCMTVEPDGVTMALDPARSDLLIDAELGRFADELARPAADVMEVEPSPRRFQVGPASLRRAFNRGVGPQQIADWYRRRTGGEAPPAVQLLLNAHNERLGPLRAAHVTVLSHENAGCLDGLLQHPETRPWLGERLGPNHLIVPSENLPALRQALQALDVRLEPGP